MGTRADFYVGRGPDAFWMGSVAWDGYPDGLPNAITHATEEWAYKRAVLSEIEGREDGTVAEQGWPWPWDDSRTTDYAYAFEDGVVWASGFGHAWFKASEPEPSDEEWGDKVAVFPNMTALKRMTMGSRSGVMVIGPEGPVPGVEIGAQEAQR